MREAGRVVVLMSKADSIMSFIVKDMESQPPPKLPSINFSRSDAVICLMFSYERSVIRRISFLTYGHGTFSFVYTRKDDIIAVAIPHDFPVVFRVEMIYVKGQPDDVQHFFPQMKKNLLP